MSRKKCIIFIILNETQYIASLYLETHVHDRGAISSFQFE